MSAAPLAPVKVLDLSRMYPGAFCTSLLADLGADVVKVEAPGAGDGMRMLAAPGAFNAGHTALNRGKRSVALDLRQPSAGDVLRPLVRWADVVVESHRPGQLDGLGLGYEAMRLENPAIVWCSITGFGTTGPNVVAPGHDLTFLGASGVLGSLAAGDPSPPAITVALPMAASMAAVAVLAALHEAGRTGTGSCFEVNMTDSASWLLSEDVARAANAPAPGWGDLAGRNVYRCADGRWVTVASTEPRTWAALAEALGDPEVAAHRLGVDDEGPMIDRLTGLFASKPAAEWLAHPGFAGGVGPVHAAADLLHEPQVVERGSLVELDGGAGTVLANPIRPAGGSGVDATRATSAPPALGADTDEVLRAVGLDAGEIERLRAAGVIA